jgi:hypothetical protein
VADSHRQFRHQGVLLATLKRATSGQLEEYRQRASNCHTETGTVRDPGIESRCVNTDRRSETETGFGYIGVNRAFI